MYPPKTRILISSCAILEPCRHHTAKNTSEISTTDEDTIQCDRLSPKLQWMVVKPQTVPQILHVCCRSDGRPSEAEYSNEPLDKCYSDENQLRKVDKNTFHMIWSIAGKHNVEYSLWEKQTCNIWTEEICGSQRITFLDNRSSAVIRCVNDLSEWITSEHCRTVIWQFKHINTFNEWFTLSVKITHVPHDHVENYSVVEWI